jgi:hypothetical protein
MSWRASSASARRRLLGAVLGRGPLPGLLGLGPFGRLLGLPCLLGLGAGPDAERRGDDAAADQGQGGGDAGRGQGRVAPAPAPGALDAADRPGGNGAAVEERLQVVGQGGGRGVAPGRLLVQALEADRLQVARQPRHQPAGRHRLVGQHLQHRVERRLGPERRAAGQALVEDGAQGVDVGGGADLLRLARRLLRRHVGGGAEDGAGLRLAADVVQALGQAEVGDPQLSRLRLRIGCQAASSQEDVRRLEVAVDHAGLVGGVDGAGQRLDQRGCVAGG